MNRPPMKVLLIWIKYYKENLSFNLMNYWKEAETVVMYKILGYIRPSRCVLLFLNVHIFFFIIIINIGIGSTYTHLD